MKIRRKTNECPNCGANLNKVYNYCPMCGQENTSNYVSLKTLLGDFFNTYFALDSKFAKTVSPFFFKPGYLTNKYSEGKRASYTHPLRLYLILSLFFFFVFKKVANTDDLRKGYNNSDGNISVYIDLDDVEGLSKETKKALTDHVSKKDMKAILKAMNKSEDQEAFQRSLQTELSDQKKETLKSALGEKALFQIGLTPYDSLTASLKKELQQDSLKLAEQTSKSKVAKNKNSQDSTKFILARVDWDLVDSLKHEESYSDEQLLDSMYLGELGTFDHLLAIQAIRINRDPDDGIDYILSNLPIMMLFLVPVFAAILKLLYIRRKHLYIKHLIHALNLHSFVYFFYGCTLLLLMWFDLSEKASTIVTLLGFIIASVYAYISFLKVYKQGWFKTLVKFKIVGWLYFTFISLFLVSEAFISLLLF
ncbi:DUF3667 domain-containing protein [Fulvivirga ligni]|uniref:DUF3667 domain-containing protein n=1 Tax=Fulvivirga ligni TaxID=2904246 RepID=UPI001F15D1FD|nr:DUF3667 domain-containing protein [Fulvivirga ligni]UII20671.1 DUF3667 domain-containing protein [Fulvivirga ligni]